MFYDHLSLKANIKGQWNEKVVIDESLLIGGVISAVIQHFSTNHIDTASTGDLDHIINGPCSSSGCLVDFPTHGGKVYCKLEIFPLHRRDTSYFSVMEGGGGKSDFYNTVKPVI